VKASFASERTPKSCKCSVLTPRVLGNPFTYNAVLPITASQFHYTFGNHLSTADSKILWEKYSIPAAAHILWQGAFGVFIKRDRGVYVERVQLGQGIA
jgi:hypothetical protein